MIKMRSFPLYALAGACLLSVSALAQQNLARIAAPTVRIVNPINENQLVTLSGNTLPAANARNDRGAVSPTLPMTDLILVLSRSPEQQAAFDAFVAGLSNVNSANYHQWLTPEEVGENYGPSQADISTVTNWLAGRGFAVTQVTKDHMSIRFSGTAALVTSTFHTEIHNLVVNGVPHIANMSDPQIPAALSTVVVGIKSLHNFFPRPQHHMGQSVVRDAQSGKWVRRPSTTAIAPQTSGAASSAELAQPASKPRPQFGISVGGANPYLVEDVGPYDFATIYNVAPLWNAGIDGTGQTIAIAATSAIDIGETTTGTGAAAGANGSNDVATFRTFFNLPTNNSYNTPIQISGNSQALTVCTDTTGTLPYPTNPCGLGDLEENSLDAEWSASVAKNAQVILVSSYPASTTDDTLYDSESYIVDHLTAHIMNVSYGECELGMGTAGNVQYYDLWQTAAAEGIAVFVATGDSGSPSCDQGGDANGVPYVAQYGLSVNGIASTPYNTAVGGTDFNWCPLTSTDACATEASTYWNTTNNTTTESSAKGYVPELPWNDTCTSPLALAFLKSFFNGVPYTGSGNQSISVTDAETSCNGIGYYAQQLENSGDGVLLNLVDTVGGGGGASACVVNTSTPTGTTIGTCTTGSTTTGSSNGNIALTSNGWQKPSWQTGVTGIPNDGVRDIPDVSFFASDGFLSSSAYLFCVSAAAADYGGGQACSYSSSSEPFALEVGGTSVATPAMAGVMALVNQKTGAVQGSPNAELYSLAAKQNYGSCSAESGSTSNGCYFNDIDTGTIAMACASSYFSPASPNCTVAHAGDYYGILSGYNAATGYDQATGLGSLNIANVVNGWTAIVGLAKVNVGVAPSPTSINSNNSLSVTVTVAGTGTLQDPNGQTVIPTGSVTLTASGSTYNSTGSLNANGTATFTIPANSLPGAAPPGKTDTLTAAYAGDANYAATSGASPVTVITTVASLTPTVTVTPATTTLNSDASLNVTVSVTGSGITPTGTITLSGGQITSIVQTIGTSPCTSNTSCVFTIPANSLSAGTDTLTAVYNGDGNYQSANSTAQVTVTESTFKLTAGTPSSSSVTPGTTATVSVTVSAVAGYTGTVSLTCGQSGTTASGGDGTTCAGGGSTQAVNLATCGTSCSVTFTIGTSAPVTAALDRPKMPGSDRKGWLGAGSGALLALLVFFGIPARRRSWRTMLGILIALVALGGLSSCGGGSSSSGGGGGGQSDPGTTAGTYTYSVTATPTPSVSPTVSTTFTVTVN